MLCLQAPTAAEYAERRREMAEFREKNYTQVNMSSKVDVLIDDVEKIMQAGPDDTGCACFSFSACHAPASACSAGPRSLSLVP